MTKKKVAPAVKMTIAATLAGSGDTPVANLSTTVDITKESTHTDCHGCSTHDVQFVTRSKVTTLRCKICDSEVAPADQGEADSLAAYNKDVDTGAVKE